MKRKYPVGIQSFESIRQDGYIYVDPKFRSTLGTQHRYKQSTLNST